MFTPSATSHIESGSGLRNLLEALAPPPPDGDTLDPSDWPDFRAQAHRMLDDILDYTEHIRERPVWQPIPPPVRDAFRQPLPQKPANLASIHNTFMRHILPYSVGNAHPGFMGWVHGGGTPVGMLAEMLAAGLNANLGGRDQIPVEVERQVVRWVRELFRFPDTASGLFVTGTSMANLIAVLVARTGAIGIGVRRQGIAATGQRLIAYTSAGAHSCIAQAMDLSGLGSDALRIIPVNRQYQIDIRALQEAIVQDKSAGLTPFLIAATAGTVDVGAIDDLTAVADIAQREKLWFHVDGAYGALLMLAPDMAPRLAGIERADSIAFDFHKWGQVPYDAGFVLVRDGTLHHGTFASPAAYLRREARGMAAGSPWPCDFGPDLSRGFRALKTWFTISAYGAAKLGAMISKTCALAQYLKRRIEEETALELLAPVALNIVCFRYRSEHPDEVNRQIVADLQESGIAAPSTTTVNGCLAIRAAIVNHRTGKSDIDALIQAAIAFGSARVSSARIKAPLESLPTMNLPASVSLYASAPGLTNGDSEPLIGLAPLARMAFVGADLAPLKARLLGRLAEDAYDANALLDLSTVLQLMGQRQLGLSLQASALDIQPLYRLHASAGSADSAGIRLLAILGPGDLAQNNALEFLVEGSDITLDMLYVSPGMPIPATLPDHDLAMVALCETDQNRPLLEHLETLVKSWPRPVLCAPGRIARLSRDGACRLLQSAPGMVVPVTTRIGRPALESIGRSEVAITAFVKDGAFPIIIRPVDSQKGHGLVKADTPYAIADYLQTRPENAFYVARYVEYRGPDGQFRKYRIVLIDQRPYVCHMAISDNWVVHYMSAGMVETASKRAEEARFFAGFDDDFARRHHDALLSIAQRMELEYVGIDCGETPAGELLIFEVDSGMTVHAMDPVDIFPYKQPQMRKVFRAFRQMLIDAAYGGHVGQTLSSVNACAR